jgi:hypothetical protein
VLEASAGNFGEFGTIQGANSVQTTWPSFSNFTQGFFVGLTNFSFTSDLQPQISLQNSYPFNISSMSGYSAVIYNYLNIWTVLCSAPDIYYRAFDQICYTTCPGYTFTNITSTSCIECDYSCYSCTAAGSNLCSSCDSAAHRTLVNFTCPCISGYFDTGVSECSSSV